MEDSSASSNNSEDITAEPSDSSPESEGEETTAYPQYMPQSSRATRSKRTANCSVRMQVGRKGRLQGGEEGGKRAVKVSLRLVVPATRISFRRQQSQSVKSRYTLQNGMIFCH